MTALIWDKVGERRYEVGVDRGVLYLPDGTAVPWNGLTSVNEVLSREIKSFYLDGVKYRDNSVPGAYAAKLQAFTYPDELDELIGKREFSPGVVLYDQPTRSFDLSYRTLIGNDIDGQDHGYKIHIVYNVQATPSDITLTTIGDTASINPFEWNLMAVPSVIPGVRPTSHIALDSRRMDASTLDMLEDSLYGTSFGDPSLPRMNALLSLAAA